MAKKPRTPRQLAKVRPEKKTYSFHLMKANTEQLIAMAHVEGISISEIIDEAIAYYLEAVKEQNSK